MLSSSIRTLSFFSKWFAELVREPMLMASLVLGPFLILLLFGVGAQVGNIPKPRTLVVVPAEQTQEGTLGLSPDDVSQYLTIVDSTTDREAAVERLTRGEADLVVVLPADPRQRIASGERAPLEIITNEIDPLKDSYARAYLNYQIATLNQRALERTIAQAQAAAPEIVQRASQARQWIAPLRQAQGDVAASRRDLAEMKGVLAPASAAATQALGFLAAFAGLAPTDTLAPLRDLADRLASLNQAVDQLDRRLAEAGSGGLPTAQELDEIERQLASLDAAAGQLATVSPAVLSAPFELKLSNAAPFELSTLAFYAPAVLALLLQHLGVTLGALSLARVRLIGLMELLQTSPVRPSEVVVGNYLSYGTLCLIAAGALVALLTFALSVPMLGSPPTFVLILVLLVFASLGLGFVISLVVKSEQQAAQLAMLVLIASTFFSGFLIFLELIDWPVRIVSYLLPATYAIRALREVMLRGVLFTPTDLVALGVMGLCLFIVAIGLFRREFRAK